LRQLTDGGQTEKVEKDFLKNRPSHSWDSQSPRGCPGGHTSALCSVVFLAIGAHNPNNRIKLNSSRTNDITVNAHTMGLNILGQAGRPVIKRLPSWGTALCSAVVFLAIGANNPNNRIKRNSSRTNDTTVNAQHTMGLTINEIASGVFASRAQVTNKKNMHNNDILKNDAPPSTVTVSKHLG